MELGVPGGAFLGGNSTAGACAKMFARASIYALIAILGSSCHTTADENLTSAEAERVATTHAKEVLPEVRWSIETIKTEDLGTTWRVTFTPPPGSTGDPLTVEVDKGTGSIVKGLRGPCYIDERPEWKNPCEFSHLGTPDSAFSVLDVNNDRKIGRSEWQVYSDRQTVTLNSADGELKRDYASQLSMLFDELDTDSNGDISKAEWDQSQIIRFDLAPLL